MGCLYIVVVSKGSTYSHTIMNTHTQKNPKPQNKLRKKNMKFYQMEKCRTVAFRQIMIACLYEPVFPRDVQVRSLEAKNRQLELNIAEFCQQKSTVVTKNYDGYFSTISDLRAEVPLTLYITQHTEKQTILQCTHETSNIAKDPK